TTPNITEKIMTARVSCQLCLRVGQDTWRSSRHELRKYGGTKIRAVMRRGLYLARKRKPSPNGRNGGAKKTDKRPLRAGLSARACASRLCSRTVCAGRKRRLVFLGCVSSATDFSLNLKNLSWR